MRPRGARRDLPADQAEDPRAVNTAAAALLARRDYASAELRQKLLDRGFVAVAVDSVLATLAEQRIVDDVRFAERFVAYQARRGQGPVRIRQDLKRWLAAELIEQALIDGCLLYTSDAADERSSVDLGGRRIIKKKKKTAQAGRRTQTISKRSDITE